MKSKKELFENFIRRVIREEKRKLSESTNNEKIKKMQSDLESYLPSANYTVSKDNSGYGITFHFKNWKELFETDADASNILKKIIKSNRNMIAAGYPLYHEDAFFIALDRNSNNSNNSNNETFDLKIKDSGLQNAPDQFKQLPRDVFKKIEDVLTKLHHSREAADDYGRSRPQSYYNGVNKLQKYIIKEFKKVGIDVEAGEGDDEFIELYFKN